MTEFTPENSRETRLQRLWIAAGPLPVVGIVCALALAVIGLSRSCPAPRAMTIQNTVADLSPVHAGITVAGRPVSALARVSPGARIQTDGDGRARLRLDDGTTYIIDRSTRFTVGTSGGVTLEEGRLFAESPANVKSELSVSGLSVHLSGGNAGIETHAGEASVYAAGSELTVTEGGAEHQVASGESAHWSKNKLEIAPERAFDDWTFGLAAPWAAHGEPRRALGELWSSSPGEPSSPLTIRAHDVSATVERELARTRTQTSFFNGGSGAVNGDFRFALPPGAVVSRFAVNRGGNWEEGHIALAARATAAPLPSVPVLEWAGEGWLRGSVPSIAAGQTVQVSLEYVQWLAPRHEGGHTFVEYRYPLVGEGDSPVIGEFSAHLDASKSSPISLSASAGSTQSGSTAEMRRSDFRPAADWVVTIEESSGAGRARLYRAPPTYLDTDRSDTVMLRTELPVAQASDGVTLALVLDTSGSVEPGLLDAERALTEAILAGLGTRDRVVVLAADQSARAVGPAAIGPLDEARRTAIAADLSALSPGGASDLGRALEAAADALPKDAPSAMVIYLGDGWPTLGDATVEQIRARLARRAGGSPRIGAVAVGPLANRTLLAALARGKGPLLEIADTADAARTAVELIADALRPAVSNVEVDFGPLVERVYPRTPRVVALGESFTAVGRARGELPKNVVVRWRDEHGAHEETRVVENLGLSAPDDVRRRWALARVEEAMLGGQGRETATQFAWGAGLLTPWTAFLVGPDEAMAYTPTPFATRILDLSANGEGVVAPAFATPASRLGTLSAPKDLGDSEDTSTEDAVRAAAARSIESAYDSVRACRNSRVALRPELSGSLAVSVIVSEDGVAQEAQVRGTSSTADDPALNACVAVVLRGLSYPSGFGVRVTIEREIQLPPATASLGAHRCSATAALPMPLRRGVWQERLERADAPHVYREAKAQCELATWSDRRALLELILLHVTNGPERVGVARQLEQSGEADAAALLRREAVRRAATPDELRAVRLELLGDEHYPVKSFEHDYQAAASNEARLSVVRKYLTLAPHDARLRGRLLAVLEALGQKSSLSEEIRKIRLDPFADAALLADSAAALGRLGDAAESARTFGELAERAPSDPWVRGFLGDRLRAEHRFDDAVAAYSVLEQLAPDDAAATLRLGIAHAEAGRTDLAERLFARVLETGGREGSHELADFGGYLARIYAANALAAAKFQSPAEAAELLRLARELPREVGVPIVLARSVSSRAMFNVVLERGPEMAREQHRPDLASEALALYALRAEDLTRSGSPPLKLVLSRPRELVPADPTRVRVDTLLGGPENEPSQVSESEVELPADGSKVVLIWRGSSWQSG